MPALLDSLVITDAYRNQLLLLRLRLLALLRSRWALDFDDLDASYRPWLSVASELLTAAQREGVRLSDAYLAAFLSSELGEAVPPPGLAVQRYAGRSRDGRSIRSALLGPIITAKVARGRGFTPEQSSRMAMARALRTVSMEAAAAPQRALTDAMRADERVVGWRRVTSANPCGACLGSASGKIRREPIRVHAHCRCSSEPVVRGVREWVKRPTGAELFEAMSTEDQDRLFAGRGGERKAALVRSGRVSLGDLVSTSHLELGTDVITETPLTALV